MQNDKKLWEKETGIGPSENHKEAKWKSQRGRVKISDFPPAAMDGT